jgi:DNA gyrase/topoisomerase IV subunit B
VSTEIRFPIQIDGFTFNELSFSANGREYSYEDVASLKFQIQNTTINFSTDETYFFGIRTSNDETLNIRVSDAAFSFNKKKVAEKKRCLLAIANHVNGLTFQRRLNAYLEQMQETGCVQYKVPSEGVFASRANTIFIYGNGDVSLAGKTVNVKRAREAGTLKFGTAYGLGCDSSINPFEISINEKPPIFGGRVEGTGSLRFDAGWDFPMI